MTTSSLSPPYIRTIYVLTNSHGWCLYHLEGSFPLFSPDPIQALRNRYTWLVQDEAWKRCRDLTAQLSGITLGVTTVELVQNINGWQAVSMAGVPYKT